MRGETATSDVAVGAHQSHLKDGPFRQAVSCSECHVVPSQVDSPGHMDGSRPPVTFGPLARTDGLKPSWDSTSASCSSVYCHGATVPGGSLLDKKPKWTQVDGTQAACGTCHGIPPPAPHPSVSGGTTACAGCHPGTVKSDGTIDVAGGKHINGTVDLAGGSLSCTSCHGDSTRAAAIAPAPPRDTKGNTATTALGVGAHQSHLNDGPLRLAVACSDCHTVPSSTSHSNGTVDITFSAFARTGDPNNTGGPNAAFNPGSASCSATYCHGATLAGGPPQSPSWKGNYTAGATTLSCGSCHGFPPPSPHPSVSGGATACAGCHPGTVKADGTIDVAGGKHINGTVDLAGGSLSCTSCHGDSTRAAAIAPAPPRDTKGNTATTALGVGAHQSHLVDSPLRQAVACSDCHAVPSSTAHSNGTVDFTFSKLATQNDSLKPAFNPGSASCSATYCHGATLAGGPAESPKWTGNYTAGATTLSCGSCHGFPPPSPHPFVSGGATACAGCHPGTVKADGTIDVAGGKHINGAVDISGMSCTSCHGNSNRAAAIAAAPPKDTRGNTATTALGVGAHQSHLVDSPLRKAVACTDCHTVPSSTLHSNRTVDFAFSDLATKKGLLGPAFNPAGATCSSTYCHGGALAGGPAQSPSWTGNYTAGATTLSCGSCHGFPPPNGAHKSVSSSATVCAFCHSATVKSDGTIDVAGGKHINGTIDPPGGTLSCTSCHGDAGRTAVPGADGFVTAAPPVDTRGNTAPTERGVGAHEAHVNKGTGAISTPIACSECHVVPSSTEHSNGVVNVTFGSKAKTGGASPKWNGASCSASYCHGNFTNGNKANVPNWTAAGQAACGTCHSTTPTSGQHPAVQSHHRGFDCSFCHGPGYSTTASPPTVNATLHVNGAKDVPGAAAQWNPVTRSCAAACHDNQQSHRW